MSYSLSKGDIPKSDKAREQQKKSMNTVYFSGKKPPRFKPEHTKTLIATSYRFVMPRFEYGTYSYLQTIICMTFENKDFDVIDMEERITERKRRNVQFARECMNVPVRFYLLPASNHNARSQSPPK